MAGGYVVNSIGGYREPRSLYFIWAFSVAGIGAAVVIPFVSTFGDPPMDRAVLRWGDGSEPDWHDHVLCPAGNALLWKFKGRDHQEHSRLLPVTLPLRLGELFEY